jgi:hypothetical protein
MTNLTKKALSLIVCLLLLVSAISGAFSISAENTVNDEPLNLDFSDGLNHWLNTDKVKVEDGSFIFEQGRQNWVYLTSEEFKIPNAEVGDTITFSIVVSVDSTLAASDAGERVRVYFDTTVPGETMKSQAIYYNSPPSGAPATRSITVEDPEQTFKIRICKASECKDMCKMAVLQLSALQQVFVEGVQCFFGGECSDIHLIAHCAG